MRSLLVLALLPFSLLAREDLPLALLNAQAVESLLSEAEEFRSWTCFATGETTTKIEKVGFAREVQTSAVEECSRFAIQCEPAGCFPSGS